MTQDMHMSYVWRWAVSLLMAISWLSLRVISATFAIASQHANMWLMQIQQLNLYPAGALTIVNNTIEASLSRCFNDVLKQSWYETEQQQVIDFNR